MKTDGRHPPDTPVPRLLSVKPRLPQAGAFSLLRHFVVSRQDMCKYRGSRMSISRKSPDDGAAEAYPFTSPPALRRDGSGRCFR